MHIEGRAILAVFAFATLGCGAAVPQAESEPAFPPTQSSAPVARRLRPADAPPADASSTPGEAPAEGAIFPEWPVDDGRFSAVFPEEPRRKQDPTRGAVTDTFVNGDAIVIVVCAPAATAAGWRATASAAGWRQFDFYGTTAMSDAEHDAGKSYLREQLEVRGRYCLLQASFRDAVPSESAVAQACLRSFRPSGITAPAAQ
jgi:hypothetical protein